MKNLQRNFFAFLFVSILAACNSEPSNQAKTTVGSNEPVLVDDQKTIEEVYQKEAFLKQSAIQFDLKLTFRGKERLKGKMTLKTNSTASKIDYANGNTLLYNESGIFHSDSMGSDKKLRFDAYTWSYFFLFPYKLSDPGTNWEKVRLPQLNNREHNTYKLSFDAGVGDAPDDWYKLYVNKSTGLIEVSSYIVTANKSREEAEKDPHAIEYSNYKTIDGIPLAHNWSFWGWTKDSGLTEQIGSAELRNIKFVTADDNFFHPAKELIEIK